MNKIISKLKRFDWGMIVAILVLMGFSLSALYSISFSRSDFSNFKKQIIFFAIGIALMIGLSFFDFRFFKENSFGLLFVYFASILLLLGLFFFAPATRNVRRWYNIGPISFDPVESLKIVLIIVLAKFFSVRHISMYKFSHIILSGAYVLLPAIITFFQPDMGSALILIGLWIGILFVSGIKTKHFLILCLIGVLMATLAWTFLLKDYQKTRIVAFLEPKLDPQGINWNPEQAKIAIGNGGIWGKGKEGGSQTRLGFLPVPHTDFIFSSIAEERGFVGVIVLLSAFLLLIFRILKISVTGSDNFSRLFGAGLAIIILIQVFVNIGMNLGIFPIVGIPLPLVSYGGSNLVFTLVGLGILQGLKTN